MSDDNTPITEPVPFVHRSPRRRRAAAMIRLHTVDICATIGLRRYRDASQAREALESCRWRREWDLAATAVSNRREVRQFLCDARAGRHLSSAREPLPSKAA